MRRVTFPIKVLYTIPDMMLNAYFRHVLDFCVHLDRNLFVPAVCAADLDPPGLKLIRETGAEILQLQLYPRPREAELASTFTAPSRIRRERFAIQHSFHWSSLWLEGVTSKLARVPLWITTKTGMEWDNHRWNWKIKCALSDKIVTLNQTMQDALSREGFRKKAVVIPLGIDIARFSPRRQNRRYRDRFGIPDSAFVIGYLAQFVPNKDHATLVRAFAPLVRDGWPVYLLLAGNAIDKDCRVAVEALCRDLGVADRVFFPGFVDDPEVFLNSLDCLAFTSRMEAFGMAVIEAMSCGLPVIATRSEGPSEIVADGQTGALVPIGDASALTRAILEYLKDPDRKGRHGVNARQRVEELYSSQTMVRRHEVFYLEALREKGLTLAPLPDRP
jgi:glycosyltransferase involved in cell wall biosynthesis